MGENMVSGENAVLAGVVFAVMTAGKGAAGKFFETPTGQRILPVLPLVLGVAFSLSGFCDPSVTRWQARVVVGLLSGALAGQMFKVGRTSIMGKGVSEPEPNVRVSEVGLPPAATPAPETVEPGGEVVAEAPHVEVPAPIASEAESAEKMLFDGKGR